MPMLVALQGDGITNCNAANASQAAASMPKGYSLRGTMEVERLDSLLSTEVKAIKVGPRSALH